MARMLANQRDEPLGKPLLVFRPKGRGMYQKRFIQGLKQKRLDLGLKVWQLNLV